MNFKNFFGQLIIASFLSFWCFPTFDAKANFTVTDFFVNPYNATTGMCGTADGASVSINAGDSYCLKIVAINANSNDDIRLDLPQSTNYTATMDGDTAPNSTTGGRLIWNTTTGNDLIRIIRVTTAAGAATTPTFHFVIDTDGNGDFAGSPTGTVDVSPNVAINVTTAPTVQSSTYYDSNADGTIDQLKLVFSESVQKTMPNWKDNFALGSCSFADNGTYTSGSKTLTFSLSGCAANNTALKPQITYTSGNIENVAHVALATIAANDVAELDGANPIPALTSSSANLLNSAPFSVTVTFSEIINNFVVGDITVTNGSVGNFVNQTANRVWTFDVTPTTDGTVTVNVSAGIADDGVNNNLAAVQLSRSYDATPPTVTLSTDSGSVTSAFSVTAQFLETVTGFAVGDISVSNGSAGSFVAVDGDTYTFTVTPSVSGTVTVNIAGAVAVDAANNGNTAASQLSVNYTAPSSGGGGGGGGGGGSSGPDITTPFFVPAAPADVEVVLNRPIYSKTGEFNRSVTVEEYYLKSSFSLEKETKATHLDGSVYVSNIQPILRTSMTKFTSVSLPAKKLIYESIFTVAGDKILYSKPVKMHIVLPSSLKNFVQKNTNYEVWYWVPSQRFTGADLVSSESGKWKKLGGAELVKDGMVDFSLDHSTYLAFVSGVSASTGTIPATPVMEAAVFANLTDIQNHWAKDYIIDLYNRGVVKGQGDSKKFFPDETINRAAFLKIILELFKYDLNEAQTLQNPFHDISSSDWFTPYVLVAYKAGIVKGYPVSVSMVNTVTFSQFGESSTSVRNLQKVLIQLGFLHVDATGYFGQGTQAALVDYQKAKNLSVNGTLDAATLQALDAELNTSNSSTLEFRPNQNINRAEALKMIFLAAKLNIPESTVSDFTDVPVNQWFAKFVTFAKANGVVRGKTEKTFAPSDSITRAEAVKIALKVLNLGK